MVTWGTGFPKRLLPHCERSLCKHPSLRNDSPWWHLESPNVLTLTTPAVGQGNVLTFEDTSIYFQTRYSFSKYSLFWYRGYVAQRNPFLLQSRASLRRDNSTIKACILLHRNLSVRWMELLYQCCSVCAPVRVCVCVYETEPLVFISWGFVCVSGESERIVCCVKVTASECGNRSAVKYISYTRHVWQGPSLSLSLCPCFMHDWQLN